LNSIIRQDHSWGRFRITYPAFKEIVDFLRATVEFLDVVGCFGVKTSEDERVLTGYKFCTRQKQCPHEQHGKVYLHAPPLPGRRFKLLFKVNSVGNRKCVV